jgi:acid phosphatase family membrane protein YuiD
MRLREVLLFNPILFSALSAWLIAQILKVVIELIKKRRLNLALLFEAGGMPSSHSALVSATALSAGLAYGFNSPIFSVTAVLAMIVIYDATGVRRESGRQAALINSIIEGLSKGKIPPQDKLKEMLGHTPGEAFMGTLLGLSVGYIVAVFLI